MYQGISRKVVSTHPQRKDGMSLKGCRTHTKGCNSRAYPGRRATRIYTATRMFGPFSSSIVKFGSYLRKLPFKMSQSRKRHIRERLKNVENTLNILNNLGLEFKALDRANLSLRYSKLSPLERYTYFSRKHEGRRPVHFYPHYTKVDIPTTAPYGYK